MNREFLDFIENMLDGMNKAEALPIWALARESHAALAAVDETLWSYLYAIVVQYSYA